MSLLSFGTHLRKEKEPVVLLHIEGERVSGALALRDCGESHHPSGLCHAPKILYSCDETFPVHRPSQDMNAAILLLLKKVVDRIEKEGLPHLTFTKLGVLRNDAVV